jgi:hypothetical protein
MARILHSLVAPNATAQGHLGTDYGFTFPQDIIFGLSVKKAGNDWAPVVDSMNGQYSVQARLLGHQTDLTDANVAALVDRNNYVAVLAGLNSLGTPGNTCNFYSLAAVKAHEYCHANRCRLALENKAADIIESIETLRVRINPGGGAADRTGPQALTAIRALPAYALAVTNAWNIWFTELIRLVAEDHTGEAWCEVAERRIVAPLIATINALAVTGKWLAGPAQVQLPAQSLGVQVARNQINGPAQVVQVGPPAPVTLPDGALGVAAAQVRFAQAAAPVNAPVRLGPIPKKNLPAWPPPPAK